jgi:uncharacterized membrane protein YhaH (DUF805 family)
LPLCGLALLAAFADPALGYDPFALEPPQGDTFFDATGGPLSALLSVLTLVPSISSMVARLHDRGHSAWWLLWYLVPIVGWIVLVVDTGFLRGHGHNRYGPEVPAGWSGTRRWQR